MPASAFALVALAGLIHASWNIAAKKAGGDARFACFTGLVMMVFWAPLGLWLGWQQVPRWGAAEWAMIAFSGILHVLKTGCRWQDCPAEYDPSTTIYNRFNRWSRRQLWSRILDALVAKGVLALSASIDSSHVKAHRSAHGGKGGEASVHRTSRGADGVALPKDLRLIYLYSRPRSS